MLEGLLVRLAHRFPPEIAHEIALSGLESGFMPLPETVEYASLATEALGYRFTNPLGVAAGFDKNARVFQPLLEAGAGFVEVGTVTPKPQKGNPKPRLFRLSEDRAVVNRLGFNNEGMRHVRRRLPERAKLPGIVGVNLGKNKDSDDALADYLTLLTEFFDHAAYFTINISSPNTAGLRDLQRREPLAALLRALMRERRGLSVMRGFDVPILVKIAPDLLDDELIDIVEVAAEEGVEGLIVGNTTLSRPGSLGSPHMIETGGLSGAPLFALSTRILRRTREIAGNRLVLVGVGGVETGAQMLEKIRAGATLVQLYTGLVYGGFGLIQRIKDEAAAILEADRITDLAELRGSVHSPS